MRVLIVEDDSRVSRVLCEGLTHLGMTVATVTSGVAAVGAAQAESFDLILLDVMLGPGLDGYSTCRRLRDEGVDARVLMLTARDSVEDRVRGLDAGADDYLVKPFAFAELSARIRALVRRGTTVEAAIVQVGCINVNVPCRRVLVDGCEIELTRREFDVLHVLAIHGGHVLSKEVLHDRIWRDDVVADSNLVEVYMGRLRRKLGTACDGEHITTIRNVGYRLGRHARNVNPPPSQSNQAR